jgi:hypothetical protein
VPLILHFSLANVKPIFEEIFTFLFKKLQNTENTTEKFCNFSIKIHICRISGNKYSTKANQIPHELQQNPPSEPPLAREYPFYVKKP